MGINKLWPLLVICFASRTWAAGPVNIYDSYGDPIQATGGALNVNATFIDTSIGPTGGPVPADAVYTAGNKAGTLTGFLIGQQTMANSLACVLPSDQSAIPVNQGSQGLIASPWFTEGTDGVNHASYTAGNSENVNLTGSSGPIQTNETEIGGSPYILGQALSAASAPVVIASDQSAIPTTNISVGANGAAIPANSTQIGGNESGNLEPVNLDGSGNLDVDLQTAIPSGANIIGKVGIDQTILGTTNRVYSNEDEIGGAAYALGQALSAASAPVVIASDQSSIPVTLTAGGTVSATQGTSPWVDNVSQFGGSAVVTGTGVSGAGIPRVTVSSDSSLSLNASAAIIGTVSIDQTTPGVTNGVQVNAALPAGGNNIGSVSQGSSPWVDNVSQFGGSNVVTGIGASGAGIPRVSLSNDSKVIGWDGTNQITIEPASTAALATDTSLVVQISPNQASIPTSQGTNSNASLSARQTVTAVESTVSAPANAVAVILECESVNADNIRWGFSNGAGAILSSTLGMLCEPGRDSGLLTFGAGTVLHFISTGAGSDFADVQWVLSH